MQCNRSYLNWTKMSRKSHHVTVTWPCQDVTWWFVTRSGEILTRDWTTLPTGGTFHQWFSLDLILLSLARGLLLGIQGTSRNTRFKPQCLRLVSNQDFLKILKFFESLFYNPLNSCGPDRNTNAKCSIYEDRKPKYDLILNMDSRDLIWPRNLTQGTHQTISCTVLHSKIKSRFLIGGKFFKKFFEI